MTACQKGRHVGKSFSERLNRALSKRLLGPLLSQQQSTTERDAALALVKQANGKQTERHKAASVTLQTSCTAQPSVALPH
ncbi:unnamed protein product [Soboliphyme baturini]|uniref:Transposase n=1 Tax=Soboliphyme baturini TaxID=241478 RepID=A0A183J8W5_9BILA|nr:unnamed protein product [Soboliphyme baturini]